MNREINFYATDRLLHGLLSRLLVTAPESWAANLIAVLEPRPI
jgi:hypothetical protein